MKRKLLLVLTSIAIVVVISSAWLLNAQLSQTGSEECHISLRYSIKITSNSSENESLYLPIPLKEGGKTSDLVENIQVSDGNCSWQIVNTEKGTALMVNTTGNVSLYGSFEIKRKSPVYEYDAALSMAESRTTDISEPYFVWIWTSDTSSQTTVHISFVKDMGSDGCSGIKKESVDVQCVNDWQKTKVKVEMLPS